MGEMIGQGRLARVCDLCGGVDDHPRHVIAGAVPGAFPRPDEAIVEKVVQAADPADLARLLGDLFDTGSSDRHLDCCREAGCPDGSCDVQTAGAEELRGADLLEHLMAKAD